MKQKSIIINKSIKAILEEKHILVENNWFSRIEEGYNVVFCGLFAPRGWGFHLDSGFTHIAKVSSIKELKKAISCFGKCSIENCQYCSLPDEYFDL